MAMPDFSTMTDDDLTKVAQKANNEQSRRAILKSAPSQAISACFQYQQAGGDPADIVVAVQDWVSKNSVMKAAKV